MFHLILLSSELLLLFLLHPYVNLFTKFCKGFFQKKLLFMKMKTLTHMRLRDFLNKSFLPKSGQKGFTCALHVFQFTNKYKKEPIGLFA
ncbi:hypothetical protein CL176_05810 [Suicoccus acidiformans]|uniref:Uncharacterized protein n=1 Tax=Suicoccus acidiformans TaxID=2036206 RepID=A0A347WKE0_9LACT|nr:hypothetical protein CL176_05810 [Suicoccus acidiformans]